MAALGFKGRFVDLILEGKKKQTIMNFRKYPIKPGETLYLYYGLRTKHCKKLMEVVCKAVWIVTIKENEVIVRNDHEKNFIQGYKALDKFAIADGFKDWEEMKRWWTMTHELPFVGQLIQW